MGVRLQKVIYIDNDQDAADVATAICAMVNIPLVKFQDIRSVKGSDIGFVHAATFTPVCGAWSSLNPDSQGFGSKSSYSFIECGRLRLELTEINPQLRSMFETNIPPARLMHDRERQQQLAGGEFKKLEASYYKSPSRRPRAFAPVNIVIRLHSEFDCGSALVQWYIDENAISELKPTKCAVSKYFTKSAIYVTDYKSNERRRVTPNETDSLQGLCPGHSYAFGKVRLDYITRIRLAGQCLNHFHCRIVFRYINMNLTDTVPKSVSNTNYELDMPEPEQLELMLRNLTDSELLDYVSQRMNGYPNDDLRIQMKNPDGLAYHTKYIPEVPKKFEKSAKKKIAEMTSDGRFSLKSQCASDDWVSPMFFKGKRRFDDDGDELLRTLCDCSHVNTKVEIEDWLLQYAPNLLEFQAGIKHTSKKFMIRDFKNAYELCKVHIDSQKYLVFIIKIEGKITYIQAHICVQGFSLSAYYWPAYLFKRMLRCFGWAFLVWYIVYVDDCVAQGDTDDRVTGRNRILEAFCFVNNIPISEKTPPIVQECLLAAGSILSAQGWAANNTVEKAFDMKLEQTVNSTSQAQNVRGVIQSTRTAFNLGVGEQRKWVQYTALMDQCIKESIKEKKFQKQFWIDKVVPQLKQLRELMHIAPRAFTHPQSLITDESCIIFLGDSSDDAAGCAWYKVMIPDARDVRIPEDLMDPLLTVMVGSYARGHSDEKIDWLTYENETEIMVEVLERTSSVLIPALQPYVGQPEKDICKIGVATDASAAAAIARGLLDPAAKPEYHTAKARKWKNWSDRMRFTRYYNAYFSHTAGICNQYADWLSHVGHLLSAEAYRLSKSKTEPTHVVLNAAVTQETAAKYPIPTGWSLASTTCNFTTEQWTLISKATAADQSTVFHKVLLSEIFTVLTTKDRTVPALHAERIELE